MSDFAIQTQKLTRYFGGNKAVDSLDLGTCRADVVAVVRLGHPVAALIVRVAEVVGIRSRAALSQQPPARIVSERNRDKYYVPRTQSVNKHELPPLPLPIRSPWYAQAASVLLPVGVLVVVGGHALLSPWLGEFGHDHFFETMTSQGISAVTFCTLVLLSGVFCALLASYIARRYGFAKRRSIAWSIFSFFIGPVGILAFLALLDWPALEECVSCGKKRVVDREQCTHCNASCPLRVLDGTEIFET